MGHSTAAGLQSEGDAAVKIKPCPFCGNAKPFFYHRWRVECERCGCGTSGPEASNEEDAIAWWNELPRMPAEELRAKWKRRMNAMHKRDARVDARREKDFEEDTNRWSEEKGKWVSESVIERDYGKWAADRAAWLASPINESKAS